MDFHKAGILLEKINALYKNMSTDSDSVSEIEKDLMRAYLRQFFDHFLPNEGTREEILPAELTQPDPPKPTRKVEILTPTEEKEETPLPSPKREKPKEAPAPPPVINIPPSLITSDDDDDEEAPAPEGDSEEELENLFEHHQARELSEKLGELPIQDLSKAMGLNEKIFTINELFDGDQDAFKKTIQMLNGFPAFEEAKRYLVQEIAIRYNWSHPEKKKKAKNFIKLIRRRYSM